MSSAAGAALENPAPKDGAPRDDEILVHVSVDERQPIEAIARLCRESFRIEKALTEVVVAARREGQSWTEIGRALGTTKQAAWRRFAKGPLAFRFKDDADSR